MRVINCKDPYTILDILSERDTERFVCDDRGLNRDIIIDNSVYYLVVTDNDEVAALFMYYPMSCDLYSAHSVVRPKYRSKESYKYGKASIEWMRDNTEVKCLMGLTPCDNTRAYRYALKCGFTDCGILPKSFLRDGIMIDQYITSYNLGGQPCQVD